MGTYNSAPDREQEYRRTLLAEARKGKAKACEELQREYNVRIYTDAERAQFTYVASIETAKERGKRDAVRHLDLVTEWAHIADSDYSD